jgi:hypothetical protein
MVPSPVYVGDFHIGFDEIPFFTLTTSLVLVHKAAIKF